MKTTTLRGNNFELQTGRFNTSSQGFPLTRRRLIQWWAQSTPHSSSMFVFKVGFSIQTFKLAHSLTYLGMWSYDWVITVKDFSLGLFIGTLQNVPYDHMTYVTYMWLTNNRYALWIFFDSFNVGGLDKARSAARGPQASKVCSGKHSITLSLWGRTDDSTEGHCQLCLSKWPEALHGEAGCWPWLSACVPF